MRWFFLLLVATLSAKEDFAFSLDGVEDEVLVDLPSNWEEGQRYPALFHYHGTNQRPETKWAREHAGEEDWIVVGMPYAVRGLLQWEEGRVEPEAEVLRAVRDRLVKDAGLNKEEVYLAGFKKGGWAVSLLVQKEAWVAGAAVMGAGSLRPLENLEPTRVRNKPLFIGVGRLYKNYSYSLRAKVHFQKHGARVEMVEWRGIGSRLPKGPAVGFREWLALRLGQKVDEAALEEDWQELAKLEGFEQWARVREFSARLFVQAAGWEPKVAKTLSKIEQNPEIAREVKILKESRRLLAKEIGKRSYEDLKVIADGYARIVAGTGKSPQKENAQADYERAAEVWKVAQQQRGIEVR